MSRTATVAAVAAAGLGYLWVNRGRADGGSQTPARDQQADSAPTVEVDGVTYDDPTDDQTATFEDAPGTDPETYAPDTEGDTTAPSDSTAPLSDPGDSQVYGDAPEAEDDDINDVGNMDDETAAIFDRLANNDDPEQLESDYSGSTSTSTTSSTSDDSDTSDDWETTYGDITIEENNDSGYIAPEM